MALQWQRKEIIGLAVIVLLTIIAGYTLQRNFTLEKNFKSLLQESKKTKAKVEELENERQTNQALVEQLEKDKRDLQDSVDSIKKQFETVQADLKKNADQLKAAKEEKTYLEEMLINKTKEIETLKKTAVSAPVAAAAGTPVEIVTRLREQDQKVKDLTEQNKILSDKLEKIYKTSSEKIAEIKSAKTALEQAVDSARRKLDDEWNTVNLGSIKMAQSGAASSTGGAGRMPSASYGTAVTDDKKQPSPSMGRVMVVNKERGFVIANLGAQDSITPTTEFTVSRQGVLIAVLTVIEIQDTMTACRIRDYKPGQTVEVDDTVVVRTPQAKKF